MIEPSEKISKSPCVKCTERKTGCHADCVKYKIYSILLRKHREKQKSKSSMAAYIYDRRKRLRKRR